GRKRRDLFVRRAPRKRQALLEEAVDPLARLRRVPVFEIVFDHVEAAGGAERLESASRLGECLAGALDAEEASGPCQLHQPCGASARPASRSSRAARSKPAGGCDGTELPRRRGVEETPHA